MLSGVLHTSAAAPLPTTRCGPPAGAR
jgi:hypothetical protein